MSTTRQITDAEFKAKMEAMRAEAAAEIATIRTALAAGVRCFAEGRTDEFFATVTPSARPDCPPGAWQVTRWCTFDGIPEACGHTYAEAGPEHAALVAELRALGFRRPLAGDPTVMDGGVK